MAIIENLLFSRPMESSMWMYIRNTTNHENKTSTELTISGLNKNTYFSVPSELKQQVTSGYIFLI